MTGGPKKIDTNAVYISVAVLLFLINAIKYSEKENLEVSPSIRIYECL